MAKTRKKAVKSPVKGRKSNVATVTKSPMISRKRLRIKAPKNTSINIKTLLYESPLKHLYHNGEQSMISLEDAKTDDVKINPATEGDCKCVADENEKEVASSTKVSLKTKREEENASSSSGLGISVPAKKRKLNKSHLSRFKDDDQPASFVPLDESVICVDDLEVDSANNGSAEPAVNNEDIVLIDGDLNLPSSSNCLQTVAGGAKLAQNLVDSIIVLDDEPQTSTSSALTRPAEDCEVVWSSLPAQIPTTLTRPNFDILKTNKILLDTSGESSNLRYMRNDKKLGKKSSKVTKFGVKKLTTKKVSEITKGMAKTKIAVKPVPQKTPVKKKNKDDLIFSAKSPESKNQAKSDDTKPKKGTLREIVVDGSNVAMAYTKNKTFSEKGIKMLIDYFSKKGHTVKVFVPQHRRARHYPLLEKWYNEGIVVFTPSRKLGNKNITSYDDRYILEYATACKGVVVSQDQFRDLYAEKVDYRETIEKRLLIPTFVGDYVMFPEDPLGRNGPSLAEFLKH